MLKVGEITDLEGGGAKLQVELNGRDEQVILYHGMELLVEDYNKTADQKVKVLMPEDIDALYGDTEKPKMKTFEMDEELYTSLIQISLVDIITNSIKEMDNESEFGEEAG